MNKKLSGAQLVLVPIERMGQNRFPYVENLRNRVIKYIDFYGASYLPGTATAGVTDPSDMFITVMDEYGNARVHNNLPLIRMDYTQTLGVRQGVFSRISLRDCYVTCQNAANVGKLAAFVLWYDLPEFSARNKTDYVITDSVSIPLTTATRYNRLPDEERMTGKRFRRILSAAPSITPDLQNAVTAAALQNLYITLKKGAYMVCENLPIALMEQIAMVEKSEFQNIIFDFQSSYVTIGGAGTIPNVNTDYVGKSVFLNLQYEGGK